MLFLHRLACGARVKLLGGMLVYPDKRTMHAGVDVSHKAKGKLSALELAKKRKRERAGTIIAALLAKLDPTAPKVSSHSLTLTRTRARTHTHTHTLSLPPSLSLSLRVFLL